MRNILGMLQMKKMMTMEMNMLAILRSLLCRLDLLPLVRLDCLMILKVRLLKMMSRRKGMKAMTTKFAMSRKSLLYV